MAPPPPPVEPTEQDQLLLGANAPVEKATPLADYEIPEEARGAASTMSPERRPSKRCSTCANSCAAGARGPAWGSSPTARQSVSARRRVPSSLCSAARRAAAPSGPRVSGRAAGPSLASGFTGSATARTSYTLSLARALRLQMQEPRANRCQAEFVQNRWFPVFQTRSEDRRRWHWRSGAAPRRQRTSTRYRT